MDTTSAFDNYFFSPAACDLQFAFEAIQILPNGNTAPLPSSIRFNPDLTFTIDKCSPDTIDIDPSCQEPWIETTYKVVILAKLNSVNQAQDGSVHFLVTIGNGCDNDSISFIDTPLASPQTIWLFPGEEQVVLSPKPL